MKNIMNEISKQNKRRKENERIHLKTERKIEIMIEMIE